LTVTILLVNLLVGIPVAVVLVSHVFVALTA
jgi:hypothetical protein